MSQGIERSHFVFHRNVIVLGLTSSLATFGNTLWVFLFPLVLQQEGLSPFYIGAIYSLNLFIGALAQVPVGTFADRFGRKAAIVTGTAISSASVLVLASATSPIISAAAFVMSASIGGTFFGIGVWALIAESSKENPATSFGAFLTMAGWASVFAPALGGVFLTSNRFDVFILSFFLFVVAATGRAAFLRETLPHGGLRADASTRKHLGLEHLGRLVRDFRSNRPLLMLAGAYAIYNLFLTQVSFVVPLYSAQVLKLDTAQVGLLFSIFLLVDSQSKIFFGRIADRFGYNRIILASWAGEMAFMMAFAYSQGQTLSTMLFSAWVLFGAMDGPAISARVAGLTKMQNRGASIGLFSALPMLLSVPAGLAAGFLYEVSPRLPFFANLFLGLLGLALLMWYSTTREDEYQIGALR